jgi:predicted esterase
MRPLLALLLLPNALLLAQDYGVTHREKVMVSGEPRKFALFVPKDVKKGEILPMVVAVPGTDQAAFQEIGEWELDASKGRYCVLSIDCLTNTRNGWHPSEALAMQKDAEAVLLSIESAKKIAPIDETAVAITGWSGGSYLTLHVGIRHPEVFLGVCVRSVVFFKETGTIGKAERVTPNFDMPIFLCRGDLDVSRSAKETEQAAATLKETGFRNVTHRVVPKMAHESRRDVFLEWFTKLLKETEKARKTVKTLRKELAALRDERAAKGMKPGFCSKLQALLDQEKKAGVDAGGRPFLDEILVEAKKLWEEAATLAADGKAEEAMAIYRKIEDAYRPLEISKQAAQERAKLRTQ